MKSYKACSRKSVIEAVVQRISTGSHEWMGDHPPMALALAGSLNSGEEKTWLMYPTLDFQPRKVRCMTLLKLACGVDSIYYVAA